VYQQATAGGDKCASLQIEYLQARHGDMQATQQALLEFERSLVLDPDNFWTIRSIAYTYLWDKKTTRWRPALSTGPLGSMACGRPDYRQLGNRSFSLACRHRGSTFC
jgi:hypothetical protein